MTTVGQYLTALRSRLEAGSVEMGSSQQHAQQIFELSSGWNSTEIFLRSSETIHPAIAHATDKLVASRVSGVPLQYLAKKAGFWKSEFAVGPGVLIPRPETEVLVEAMLASENRDSISVAELGPGSGNIGISLLLERPLWQWTAVEKNPDSLPYVFRNLKELLPGTANYRLLEGDFFECISGLGKFDWIVSNPPYVTDSEISRLSREVQSEPEMALKGGPTGMDFLEKLLLQSPHWLKAGGGLICEMSPEQAPATQELAKLGGWASFEIYYDYARLARGFVARKAP